jgi:thioredoxin-related protein
MRTKKVIFSILILFSLIVFSQEKFSKFQQIKDAAQQENKSILLKFSGSDWCIPCIKLQKKVIDDPIFQEYISKNLVYVEADFPRKKGKLSADIITRNKELAGIYNKQGVFPKMVLLNANGKILKTWEGFDNATVNTMIQEINQSTGK